MQQQTQTARLIVRANDKGNGIRYLTVDPQTTGAPSYSTEPADAYQFDLTRLVELLDFVRHRSGGYAVLLVTDNSLCSISERNRYVRTGNTWSKA